MLFINEYVVHLFEDFETKLNRHSFLKYTVTEKPAVYNRLFF